MRIRDRAVVNVVVDEAIRKVINEWWGKGDFMPLSKEKLITNLHHRVLGMLETVIEFDVKP